MKKVISEEGRGEEKSKLRKGGNFKFVIPSVLSKFRETKLKLKKRKLKRGKEGKGGGVGERG